MRHSNSSRIHVLLACLLLALACGAVYYPVPGFDYIHYDDLGYTKKNPIVQEGLSWQGFKKAFLTVDKVGFWIPAVWISFQADHALFHGEPGGYHQTNALIHAANSILVFLLFLSLTSGFWQSLFVAALFAVHPQAVESVAWITERKDVLSTFFWLGSMLAYAGYAKNGGWYRYALVGVFFILGLMAKSMVITLPFVLLLLDFWPLGRLKAKHFWPLVLEKIPLFLISALAGISTIAFGSLNSLAKVSIFMRLDAAITAYTGYLYKLVWPTGLAILYPFPDNGHPAWELGLGIFILALITGGCLWLSRRRPYLIIGWLWYLGTLFPVSGIMQSGVQASADRFTYVPLIGIFIMVSWGLWDLAGSRRAGKSVATILACGVIAALMIVSVFQVRLWKNTETLLLHTLEVTRDNWMAHNILGSAFVEEGRFQEARAHLDKALKITKGSFNTHYGMGISLAALNETQEAMVHFQKALEIRPASVEALISLGGLQAKTGDHNSAVDCFGKAVAFSPLSVSARIKLGRSLIRTGNKDQAAQAFKKVLSQDPENAEAHYELGTLYARANNLDKAQQHLKNAVRLAPGNVQAHLNLGNVFSLGGNPDKALAQYTLAANLDPDNPGVQLNLGIVLLRKGKLREARARFEKTLKLAPQDKAARYYLGEINKRIQ